MKLSLKLDPHMRWLYDYTHPDYNSDRAKDLRARRDTACLNAPEWMIREAQLNDALAEGEASDIDASPSTTKEK